MFNRENGRLIRCYDGEILWLEGWGENALRVRAICEGQMPECDWALLPPPETAAVIDIGEEEASITNGKIRACVSGSGKITYYNQNGRLLLEELVRDMDQKDFTSHMRNRPSEFKGIPGGLFTVTQRFETDVRIEQSGGRRLEGGQTVCSPAPPDTIPVFVRDTAVVEGLNG